MEPLLGGIIMMIQVDGNSMVDGMKKKITDLVYMIIKRSNMIPSLTMHLII